MAAQDPVSDPARTDEMVNTEPEVLRETVEEQRQSTGRAWLLWALLGSVGAHRLYLRRGPGAAPATGAALAFTVVSLVLGRRKLALAFGAVLLAAWLIDGAMLRGALKDIEREAERDTLADLAEDRIEREVGEAAR